MRLILLPGLDGTGQLFTPFLNVLPTHYLPNVINYPADETLSYAELRTYVQQRLPTDENYVVVAESFSGPIAIQVAARHPPNLKALVLCATFVSNPGPLSLNLSFLLHGWQFNISPPEFLIRRFLVGKTAPDALVLGLRQALRAVLPEVLASRAQSLFCVDVRDAFLKCRVPILYIVAKQDKLLNRSNGQEMLELKPEMEVVEIEGPHLLLQRNPTECFAAIDQFIGQVSQTNSRHMTQ